MKTNLTSILRFVLPLSAVALPCLIAACGSGSSAKVRDAEIPAGGRTGQAILGTGWDLEQEAFRGNCLDGDTVYTGQQVSSAIWDIVTDASEIQSKLGFTADARARYGAAKASLAAEFAKNSTSNAYSMVMTYKTEVRFKNAYLKDPKLTDVGKRYVSVDPGSGALIIKDDFKNGCGHEYVQEVLLGAALYMTVRIDFSTKEDKQRFAGRVSFATPASKVTSSLETASSDFKNQASVKVHMYQLGGDVSQLSTALGGAKTSIDGQSSYALVDCSITNLEACRGAINGMLKYASDNSDNATSFPKQFGTENWKPGQPGGPAVIAYATKSYYTAGITPPNPFVDQSVKAARESLFAAFDRQLELSSRINALVKGTIPLSPQQQASINAVNTTVNENIAKIAGAGDTCYNDFTACTEKAARVLGELTNIEESALEVKLENFAQYCSAAELPGQEIELKKTVDALKSLARSKLTDIPVGNDECSKYAAVLEKQESISLDNLGLSDLRPFATLTGLRYLGLDLNRIEDVSPLADLPALYQLSVDANSIKDFRPLMRSKSLAVLFAEGNPDEDLRYLREMPTLGVIRMTNGWCDRFHDKDVVLPNAKWKCDIFPSNPSDR